MSPTRRALPAVALLVMIALALVAFMGNVAPGLSATQPETTLHQVTTPTTHAASTTSPCTTTTTLPTTLERIAGFDQAGR
jgi:hypothetical protein